MAAANRRRPALEIAGVARAIRLNPRSQQPGRQVCCARNHAVKRPPTVQAYVYKSLRKADTYVYLSARDDFARLPEPLRTQLGSLQFVLEVALTPDRRLAREDAAVVRENLVVRGFHLQFPPTAQDPMTDDWGTDA